MTRTIMSSWLLLAPAVVVFHCCVHLWNAVAQWLGYWPLKRENSCLSHGAVSNLANVFHSSLFQFTWLHYNFDSSIDSGGYLCTTNLCALIALWLNVSLRSRDDIRLNRSVWNCKVLGAVLKTGCITSEI